MILVRTEFIVLNISHYILISYITTLSWYKMTKSIDKDPKVVKQNNYLTKILNFTFSII